MTSRSPRHALAISALVAMFCCTLLPTPVQAEPGKGNGNSQEEKRGHGRSDERRQSSEDKNGSNQREISGQGRSDVKHQARQDRDGGRQGGNSGHGQSGSQSQSPDEKRGNGKPAQQRPSISPQQAAQQARSQYGGQVLKVQPAGRGYQVRLLQDDGRVVTVPVGD